MEGVKKDVKTKLSPHQSEPPHQNLVVRGKHGTGQITLTDLVVSLSQMVKQKCPKVDLLIGVVEEKEPSKVFDITVPIAENLGEYIGDVCCLSSRPLLSQSGSKKWRILTTHGNADVEFWGESFEIGIHQNHLPQYDIFSQSRLSKLRNKAMSELIGLLKPDEIPYAEIQGNILLCGDFSIWNPVSLLALRKIFLANGASNVVFATPVIDSGHYRKLVNEGCNIVCLSPPEERHIGLTH